MEKRHFRQWKRDVPVIYSLRLQHGRRRRKECFAFNWFTFTVSKFYESKIDSIEICKSLEDNQLTNLGLVTIGERIKFKNAVQHWQSMPIMPMAESNTAASGSRISTGTLF